MKFILALLMLFAFTSAFAQETEVEPGNETEIEQEAEPTPTPEEEIESRTLRCNVIKTPWYLKKSFDHAKKITSCWFPGCKIRNARKSEKYFCKAVNTCDSLDEYLQSPCTEDNRLTPEARKDMAGYLKAAVAESIEYVKKLISEARN